MNIVDYKTSAYHKLRHPELLGNEELYFAWGHFAESVYFRDLKTTGKRILEYGGGLGYNLQQIKKQADVSMIEPSDIGREVAVAHGIKSYSSATEINGQVFDIILCRHVLEHIPDPLNALKEINTLLAEDGRLILVLPIEKQNLSIDDDDLNHHLFSWNAQTIVNLIKVAGFEKDAIRYEYYGMRRKLLPLYRIWGGRFYAKAIRIMGRCFNFKELVMIARKA